MPSYDDFNKLEVFTRISGNLVNQTPLRVGAGREPPLGSAVDLAPLTVRCADGRTMPFIPGSSLKGALRSLAEAIMRGQGVPVHSPWGSEVDEEAESGNYCVICGIFGSTKLASHVRIYDAYPEDKAPLFVKTGVGINREFRGAQPGVLYTEQLVAPGLRWRFMMEGVNIRIFPEPGDERGRLLRQVIDLLTRGMVQVGARKTIGYGLVKLVEGRYEVYEVKDGVLSKTIEGGIL